jgi:hypothetical protein
VVVQLLLGELLDQFPSLHIVILLSAPLK